MVVMTEQENFDNVELTEQNKVVSLFQFIQELNKLKQKAILDYKEYPYFFEISNFPNDPDNIKIYRNAPYIPINKFRGITVRFGKYSMYSYRIFISPR